MKEINKNDWSGICATSDNRNQCGENCVIFPVCKIKTPLKECKEMFEKMIDEKIEHFSKTYGKKYQTPIQKAFIFELEDLKQKLKGERK